MKYGPPVLSLCQVERRDGCWSCGVAALYAEGCRYMAIFEVFRRPDGLPVRVDMMPIVGHHLPPEPIFVWAADQIAAHDTRLLIAQVESGCR